MKYLVLTLTFFSFAQIHGTRTLWSYMQKYMQEKHDDYNKDDTGTANLVFLFTYGLGMNILGPILCRISLKYSVAGGCIATGLVYVLMAIFEYLDVFTFPLILTMMFLNGIAQSTCYPGCVAILGNWFKYNVGLLMGLWSGCTNFGDIDGLIIGDVVVQRLDWEYYNAFIIIAITLILIGVIDLFALQPYPPESTKQLIQVEETDNSQPESSLVIPEEQQQTKKINVLTAWLLPGVALYGICFACLKGTFVGFLFWLPNYIQGYPNLERQSSYISQMFDVGTFIGGVYIGYLGDKYGKRAIYIVPSLIISILLMLTVKYGLGESAIPYYFTIFGIGMFQGGPYNNISGVISIELTSSLHNDKAAISVVSSLIESTGTLTAAVFQVIIPRIGEEYLFIFFGFITFIAFLVSLVLLHGELKKAKNKQ